jgi:hypothetical protein
MEDDASQPLSVRTVFPGHPVLDGARVGCAHRLCANDRYSIGAGRDPAIPQSRIFPSSRPLIRGQLWEARKAETSWNAGGWQKVVDFPGRKEYSVQGVGEDGHLERLSDASKATCREDQLVLGETRTNQ